MREAQEFGHVPAEVDPAQLAFELEALLVAANSLYMLFGDRTAFERARAGIRYRLGLRSGRRRRTARVQERSG